MTALLTSGSLLALLSSAIFGASTPFAKLLLGRGLGPFVLAGLLYLGAGGGLLALRLGGRVLGWRTAEVGLARADLPWFAASVALGGIAAPILLMVGLASTGAAAASLLLNLETVLTMAIAWAGFGESIDRRLLGSAALVLAGAVVLSLHGGGGVGWGAIAIAGATLGWSLDNNITRKLSAADPVQITMLKGIAAGSVNLGIGLAAGGALPPVGTLGPALLVGSLGYGASLVCFVLALRHLGAARTAAYFATAPFIGAVTGLALFGAGSAGPQLVLAGLLMAVGVALQFTERHGHEHRHEPLIHSHRHTHDRHHRHAHTAADPPGEPHVHAHHHVAPAPAHSPAPDLHHRHRR